MDLVSNLWLRFGNILALSQIRKESELMWTSQFFFKQKTGNTTNLKSQFFNLGTTVCSSVLPVCLFGQEGHAQGKVLGSPPCNYLFWLVAGTRGPVSPSRPATEHIALLAVLPPGANRLAPTHCIAPSQMLLPTLCLLHVFVSNGVFIIYDIYFFK